MKIQKIDVPFTQVPNELLNDPRLSWKAKAIWSYIQSKPIDWDFATERMSTDSIDGRDATRSGIAELQKYGYIIAKKQASGRIKYYLNLPKPQTENPSLGAEPETEKPTDGKTHSGKTRPISNKDIKQRKSNTKKEPPQTESKRFIPPTLEEVQAYCLERKNKVDAELFLNHYEANGWVQNGNKKIKDWRAAVRTWEKRSFGDNKQRSVYQNQVTPQKTATIIEV